MSKSPSLRRIQADIRELALDPSDQYHAAPLENDMFEWHFTIRGAEGTDFEGGIYHGRILLPPDYPFKPPHIMFLTPSGRFETNTKICLSFSAYHPELWQPAWGIRLILEALISFLPTPADGAIGALDWSSEERKRLAKQSREFSCPICGKISELIPKKAKSSDDSASPAKPGRFAKQIEELQRLQFQGHQKKDDKKDGNTGMQKSDGPIESIDEREAESEEKNLASQEQNSAEESKAISGKSETNEAVATAESANSTTTSTPEASLTAANEANRSLPAETAEPVAARPSSGVWWLIDPLLQLIIAVLSGICYLLLRKVQALCADLRELE